MLVKQIDRKTAMELAGRGVEIKVLVPAGSTNNWMDCRTDTLQNLLGGVLFFRDEPAADQVFQDVEKAITDPPCRAINNEPVSRKTIDVGKIRALSNAGWTQKQIAEEMRLSQPAISRYLSQRELDGKSNYHNDGAYL